MKNIFSSLFSLFILTVSLNGCSSSKEIPNTFIKFEDIGKGPASGIYDAKQVVIRSESDLKSQFKEINSIFYPEPETPLVDFSKYIVIGSFMGAKNNGGYSVKIDKIRYDDDGNVKVSIIEYSPGGNCAVTDAITHPYHLVKIAKTDAKVEFDVKQEVFNCK